MRRTAVLLAIAVTAAAQEHSRTPAFDVVSVRPTGTGSRPMVDLSHGRLTATATTVRTLVKMAYQLQDFQIVGGPAWINSERFDVLAKVDADLGAEEMRSMIQSLLSSRFELALRRESREQSVYALTVTPGSPKMTKANGDGAPNCKAMPGSVPNSMRLLCTRASMAEFAAMLSSLFQRPVIDETGLSEAYAISAEFSQDQFRPRPPAMEPGMSPEAGGPSVFRALEDQLGLKLQTRKAMVPILMIETATKPISN